MTEEVQADKRIQKTLSALQDAFFDPVLTYSYDEIKVSDIIKKANVGRSTFYQHYKSKDEILVASLHYPLTTLVESTEDDVCSPKLIGLMEHFWENRKFAPRIFTGTSRKQIVIYLALLHEDALKRLSKNKPANPTIPINLAAHQLAESQLVIIVDWLLGKGACSAKKMAEHVQRTSKAVSFVWLTGK